VVYGADKDPARYYAYDRANRTLTFLFAARPALEAYELAPMRSVTIKARDGLELVSYLTVPAGREAKKLPDGVERPRRSLGSRQLGISSRSEMFSESGLPAIVHLQARGIRDWRNHCASDDIPNCREPKDLRGRSTPSAVSSLPYRGNGQITHQLQAIARFDRYRTHRRQFIGLQRRARGEQKCQRAIRAIIGVVTRGSLSAP